MSDGVPEHFLKSMSEARAQFASAKDTLKTKCERSRNPNVEEAINAFAALTWEYIKRASLDDVLGREAIASKMMTQLDILVTTFDKLEDKAALSKEANEMKSAISKTEKLACDYPGAFKVYR